MCLPLQCGLALGVDQTRVGPALARAARPFFEKSVRRGVAARPASVTVVRGASGHARGWVPGGARALLSALAVVSMVPASVKNRHARQSTFKSRIQSRLRVRASRRPTRL